MPTPGLRPLIHAPRILRTVLIVDLVESVRLMEQDEEGVIQRWLQLVDYVINDVLTPHAGRMVKSTGDGMLLEFPSVPQAVAAAVAIQRASEIANAGVPAHRRVMLRIGAQVGELFVDQHDVYGRAVNLAARLASLAGPGEIVVSAAVRDQLTPALDADIEDLGECYVKHVEKPVRAFRVGPPGPKPVIEPAEQAVADMLPTIAVIPFAGRGTEPEHELLGEMVADEIIGALSQSPELQVISRLSTTVFGQREVSLLDVREHLHANYALYGVYRTIGGRFALDVQLADTKSGEVVWTAAMKARVAGILSGEDSLIDRIVSDVGAAIIARELRRARSLPLPTLDAYTLLLGGISLMHRLSRQDFDRARVVLEAMIERSPRQAAPYAWLAKWHVLRVQQGWSDDPRVEAGAALDCTRRSLDLVPDDSLALTVSGLVYTHLLKQLDTALGQFEAALRSNPNDSLAWLLKGTMHAFRGEGKLAVQDTRRALRLSPLDPLRYYYDALAATAALSAGEYARAIELAERSLRANRAHTSTLRALAIAQWQAGRCDDARRTVTELRRLEPELTVSRYRDRHPSSDYETGRIWSESLRGAGLPD